MPRVSFHFNAVSFSLRNRKLLKAWLVKIAANESFEVQSYSMVFCNDDALLRMNRQFLQHDYFTDIITFDLAEASKRVVFGEAYISIDRIRENAHDLGVTFKDELHRVMVHGLLHLMGYNDKSIEDQKVMRSKESECLLLRPF